MSNKKQHPSGPAIFMYCVIALTLIIAILCFYIYYLGYTQSEIVLWSGVTCFTIMYHLWLRIIMGNVNKLFRIEYTMWWFKERKFEQPLYKLLHVKKWKDKALTYNPHLFSLKDYSLTDIANTMSKAEFDHLTNVLISMSTLLFSLIWGQFLIFALTAFAAIIFDAQFIIIQRYNRPRIVRLIKRQNHKKHATTY